MNAVLKRSVMTHLALASLVLLGGCVPPQAFDTSPGHISQPSQTAVPSARRRTRQGRAHPGRAPSRAHRYRPTPWWSTTCRSKTCCSPSHATPNTTSTCIRASPANVSLNAVQEPLPAILDRIARQANLRYEMNGRTVSIMPDTPYVKTYTRQLCKRRPQHHVQRRRGCANCQHGGGSVGQPAAVSSANGQLVHHHRFQPVQQRPVDRAGRQHPHHSRRHPRRHPKQRTNVPPDWMPKKPHAPSACRRPKPPARQAQVQPTCSLRHSPISPWATANTMWQSTRSQAPSRCWAPPSNRNWCSSISTA